MDNEVIEADVLIVGAGGAGLRAAISAREKGARVILANKGFLGKSGATRMAGADFTADGKSIRSLGFDGDPRDSKEKFHSDILFQGFLLNNQEHLEIYVRDAPRRLKEMLSWGMTVRSSEERAVNTTGVSITNALLRRVRETGARLIDNMMSIDLLVKDGKVVGVLGLDVNKGIFVTIMSKATILATGGWHQAYWPNAGSRDLSGDGIAMAYRAGAKLANMEFVTFVCNTLLWPPIWCGSNFGYVLHLVAGGRLTNCKGEAFLAKYDPYVVKIGTSTEWDKCFLSFASTKEVQEGMGSPHDGVYFDIGETPWKEFDRRVTKSYPKWKFRARDFSQLRYKLSKGEPVEVGPTAEYFLGGIVVDPQGKASVEGLYAAGECASSPFGSNRIAAATTEMLVTGAIAGTSAAEYALNTKSSDIPKDYVNFLQEKSIKPLKRGQDARPVELKQRIQKLAHEKMGPIRNRRDIEELLTHIGKVKENSLPALSTYSKTNRYNKEWIDALELENIVQVLELSARSALERTESRGVHNRSDFPDTDNNNWLREIQVSMDGDNICLTKAQLSTKFLKPPKGIVPYLEMMKKMMEAHSEVGGHH